MNELIQIKDLIYTIRGHRVMLDSDLAMLYEVETKVLNQAVKRNIERFPSEFCFQMDSDPFYKCRWWILGAFNLQYIWLGILCFWYSWWNGNVQCICQCYECGKR